MKYVGIIFGGVIIVGVLFFVRTERQLPDDTTPPTSMEDPVEQTMDTAPDDTLHTLDMSDQSLRTVPQKVFERTDITELDLSGNELTGALPAEVRHLQKLRILDLSNNTFTGVPAEVGQLKELEVLDLSNNQLTGLPYELGNLQNLKTLDLRGNNYSEQDLVIIRELLPDGTEIYVDD